MPGPSNRIVDVERAARVGHGFRVSVFGLARGDAEMAYPVYGAMTDRSETLATSRRSESIERSAHDPKRRSAYRCESWGSA